MIERVWLLLTGVVLLMVAAWGAAPLHPAAPWTSLQVVMVAAALAAFAGAVSPPFLPRIRVALIGLAFFGRAAIVASGVVGFLTWKPTVIATATYALLGVATVFLHVVGEQVRKAGTRW